ncbi:MAG: N-acetylmuramoyl-L-alanine amidase [Desulfovibrionaceae bacterium]|nr:N-acetylmuramoyl-L-alanine amidase [Desulfovibrionaceae bacterium]
MMSYIRLICIVCTIYLIPYTAHAYSNDVLQQLGLRIKTVVIDAGHGGKDPGTVGNGIVEKEQTLIFAKELGKKLQSAGYTVYYTRTTDVYIPLEKRTELANTKKADLFISLHCNSHHDSSIAGFETYYLSVQGSDKRAAFVASRENGVSANKLNSLQIILSDITLDSKQEESKDIAHHIQRSVLARAKQYSYTIKDKGVRSAPFFVLLGARMPSVLVELGYVSNKQEANILVQASYRKAVIQGILDAIQSYQKSLATK